MEPADLRVVPPVDDPFEIDLREVDAAIELVRRGAAIRVRLVGVASSEELVGLAAARAQGAGVAFHLERGSPSWLLSFGPAD